MSLALDPILWIKSSTLFTFMSRRFSELLLLHQNCLAARLPNYRFMSMLIVHLLRHSFVTPAVRDVELASALRELRFEEVMMGWGIFFLHDLNIKSLRLEGVPEGDTARLVKAYKTPFKEPEQNDITLPLFLELSRSQAKKEFPFGETVPESRFEELINTQPDQFLRKPDSVDVFSLKHEDSEYLFRSFTSQIWLLVDKKFCNFQPPFPSDLGAAMEFWTVQNIKEICGSVVILPTYDGLILTGRKKIKGATFGKRKQYFFPPASDLQKSPLEPFAGHQTHYLWNYYRILETNTKEKIKSLDNDLDLIFSQLQCLPASIRERGKDTVWKSQQGKVAFVVNAAFCRVKTIRAKKLNISRCRAQLTGPALQKRLYEQM